jgi:heterodisulfide reductase subunit C
LPPDGLLPESVYIAIENKALKEGNVDLLRRLATESSISSEATGMGQRIRMLGERDPDSAVVAMRELAETRKKVLEKRLKTTASKATSKEIQQIRVAKPKVTRQTFNEFVESLRC